MPSFANNLSGIGNQLAQGWAGLSPSAKGALGGAALGGGAGLLSSFARPKDERQPMSSTLTGALAGGAAGLGIGAAAPHLRQWADDLNLDEGHEQHFQQLAGVDEQTLSDELARRAADEPQMMDYAMSGTAGALGGGSLNALNRGALAQAGPEGTFYAGNEAAEAARRRLAQGGEGTGVGKQLKGLWQAVRGKGDAINPSFVGMADDVQGFGGSRWPGPRGGLNNRQVINTYLKGMSPRQMVGSKGGLGGALVGLGLPWAANHFFGSSQ